MSSAIPAHEPPVTSPARPLQVKPELLSPAGDRSSLVAAVENGADAVYFGLQRHNARARATNFDGESLPDLMSWMHRRGVRGYVTLNTLVFPNELEELEDAIRQVTEAGVDAVILQDLGLARLVREVSPDLEMHASTQMSITSEEGVRLAQELGCSRVILARELSLEEIGRIRAATTLPLEVFVHGALCVAYSGQCLTSEALGGRSANRGECAQACRMPYEIICDGKPVPLADVQYLLSPQDLAAYDLIPRMIELGVASFKIEGRLKSPEYVASITAQYRRAIDDAWAGRASSITENDVQEMQLSFSRGFSHGFLDGNNHKILVRGDHAKKRGLPIGRIDSVTRQGIEITPLAPVKPGDGLVIDADESAGLPEQGGRIYEILPASDGRRGNSARVELRFGRRDIDLEHVRPGQRVWKTDDPELSRRLRQTFEGPPRRLVDLEVRVEAMVGEPIRIEARTATGIEVEVRGDLPLSPAERLPFDAELAREQLGRLGGTIYRLGQLEVRVVGTPLVPKSQLNALRRRLVELLDASPAVLGGRRLATESVVSAHLASIAAIRDAETSSPETTPELAVLCRTLDQIEAALLSGIRLIYADFQDIKAYGEAVGTARAGGAAIFIASPRIEKPFEGNLFRFLAKQNADGLLIRNAGGLEFCHKQGIPFVADFSLNAANPLTVELLIQRGARRVTASYDLNVGQLLDLLATTPSEWLEIVIHQQIPMFHMEHCVYCAFLSPGTDKTNCGRPCDHHDVKLRDRVGMDHPLKADVGCRNTLFNAVAQSAAEHIPRLLDRRARHFRIEFLDDDAESVRRTIELYREGLSGQRDVKTLWRALRASNQYGVTRGALTVL